MFQGKEYIMAVYEEESFSKASEKLFVSQPSLSANVKRIEKRLGYEIFDRSTIPIRLTEFGQEYVANAKEIIRIEQDFQMYISKVDNLQYGKISIGGTSLFASMVLPRLMAQFSLLYPAIQLDLCEEISSELIRSLHDGEIDLLLDNTYLDEQIYGHYPFMTERLLLAVPAAYPINYQLASYQISLEQIKNHAHLDHPCVQLESFKTLPFILLKESNDTGARARAICQEADFTPQVAYQVEQQLTAYNISTSGMGISFVGEALLINSPERDQVVYYRLDSKHAQREINFYWKKDRYQTKAVQAFIKSLTED